MKALSLKVAMIKPLNEKLYWQLVAAFGDVELSHQGIEARYANGRIISDGERYNVQCPFCSDGKKHLSISYEWGVRDDLRGTNNWGRAICWRRDCISQGHSLEQLRRIVFQIRPRVPHGRTPLFELRRGVTAPQSWSGNQVELPGESVPIDELAEGHAALLYLQNVRKFDPVSLRRDWNVHYCESVPPGSPTPGARGRIIVPVTKDGVTVAWQGRIPADGSSRPKYYNLAGAWKSQLLYGFDRAKDHPFVVLVEGVTDVWRIGPPACATLGKSLSDAQAKLISQNWPSGVVIVFADDQPAWEEARPSYASLKLDAPEIKIVPITTQDGRDPAALTSEEAWQLIAGAAAHAGLSI